jgi:hypothetical protein
MSVCTKKPYTKRDAQGAINARLKGRMKHGKPDHLRTYHCPACNAWHLTHKS